MTRVDVWLCLKSLKQEWVRVVTGTLAAVAISVISYVPIGPTHHWIPWMIFLVIWSWTWGWAFARSWIREHERAERYHLLLIDEYVGLIRQQRTSLSAALMIPNEAEMRYYLEHIEGDHELIREAVWKFRAENPDSYHGPASAILS
jgi:hypothetical protein